MRIRFAKQLIAAITMVLLIGSFVFVNNSTSCSMMGIQPNTLAQCSAEFLSAPSSAFTLDNTAALPSKMLWIVVAASLVFILFIKVLKIEVHDARIKTQKFNNSLPRSFLRFWIKYPSHLYSTQDP